MLSVARPLRRRLFANVKVPLATRFYVLRSLLLTKGLYGSASLPVLTASDARSVHSMVMDMIKILFTREFRSAVAAKHSSIPSSSANPAHVNATESAADPAPPPPPRVNHFDDSDASPCPDDDPTLQIPFAEPPDGNELPTDNDNVLHFNKAWPKTM